MPVANWNLEWLNHNTARRYPITDDSSGVDTTGSFTLPTDFICALDLPIDAGMNVDPSRFFIQFIGVYASGYTIFVSYQPVSGPAVPVASAMIPAVGFTGNMTYALGGINDYVDTVGKITIGRLTNINQQPAGQFEFTLATARIEPDCVRPLLQGVSALIVSTGQDQSVRLFGDIELVAQENIQLTPIIVAGQNPQIRISAIEGDGLAQPCVCAGQETGSPIMRINGIPPDGNGNFTVLGNTCLKVNGISNGIQLSDVCSQPCCGCAELESIVTELENFGSKETTLENFVNRLEAAITEMNQVVLGSKLGDQNCFGGCS